MVDLSAYASKNDVVLVKSQKSVVALQRTFFKKWLRQQQEWLEKSADEKNVISHK